MMGRDHNAMNRKGIILAGGSYLPYPSHS